jgi:hypothetical protein
MLPSPESPGPCLESSSPLVFLYRALLPFLELFGSGEFPHNLAVQNGRFKAQFTNRLTNSGKLRFER